MCWAREYDTQGNMIFRDNLRRMIQGKNVVVLISCITSGRTVERAVQSARYYGGNVIGISSVFSAAKELCGLEVNTLFTPEDLPNYSYTAAKDCPHVQGRSAGRRHYERLRLLQTVKFGLTKSARVL